MKVLKDNYRQEACANKNTSVYPKKLICEKCGSELEYDKSDMRVGWLGAMFVDCPLCGYDNMIDDEDGITLTVDNIEFPTHFHRTSTETGAVDCFNNEEIKKSIQKAIDYFRKNKDEWCWYTCYGNLYVAVTRYEDDEDYWVVVSNDYQETYIPFETKDYKDAM